VKDFEQTGSQQRPHRSRENPASLCWGVVKAEPVAASEVVHRDRAPGYGGRVVDAARRAIGDAADAMTDNELEDAIAALHARERALLIAGDTATAFDLMGSKFVLLSTLEARRR